MKLHTHTHTRTIIFFINKYEKKNEFILMTREEYRDSLVAQVNAIRQ
jgi:hypothetical protein